MREEPVPNALQITVYRQDGGRTIPLVIPCSPEGTAAAMRAALDAAIEQYGAFGIDLIAIGRVIVPNTL